jgi:DNA-binding HxlR family transcriptional regulator
MTCILQVTHFKSWKAGYMNTSKPFARSACAVANSLDIVGDKWSLLVVRDLLHGKRTYGELALSPEHIPTNILADRLERLKSAGIIIRTPYQQRPVRYAYTLTQKGSALGEVLLAFVRWGKQHIPGTVTMNQGPAGGEVAASASNSRRAQSARDEAAQQSRLLKRRDG